MHALLRRYRIRLGTVETAAQRAEQGLLPVIRRVPGFVAFYMVNGGNNVVASVGLFETQEGAAAAERVTGDWFRDDWPSFQAIPPEVTTGSVLMHEAVTREPGARVTREGRPQVERRGGIDRRWGDRRVGTPSVRRSAAPAPSARVG